MNTALVKWFPALVATSWIVIAGYTLSALDEMTVAVAHQSAVSEPANAQPEAEVSAACSCGVRPS